MGKLITVWDDRYCTDASGKILSTSKQREVIAQATAEGLLDVRSAPFDYGQTWRAIDRVHDRTFVEAVRTGKPRQLAESQGFEWSKKFADALARTYSGHLFACELAKTAGIVFHPVSGAHHAFFEHGSGFCTFNFLAGAALASKGASMVIDLDAHQGNGTIDLVGGAERVSLFDISHADWGVKVNATRQRYTVAENSRQYLEQLLNLPYMLDRWKPELVQYQAGMDCYERDFMGEIKGMDAAKLSMRDRYVINEVRGRGIPMVICLGGGYIPGGETVGLHVQTARDAVKFLEVA